MRRAPALPRAARPWAPVTRLQAAMGLVAPAKMRLPAAVRVHTCTSPWDQRAYASVSPYVPLYRRQIVSFQQGVSCGCPVTSELRTKCPAAVPCVLPPRPQAGTWGRQEGSLTHPPGSPASSPSRSRSPLTRRCLCGDAGSLLGSCKVQTATLQHKKASQLNRLRGSLLTEGLCLLLRWKTKKSIKG